MFVLCLHPVIGSRKLAKPVTGGVPAGILFLCTDRGLPQRDFAKSLWGSLFKKYLFSSLPGFLLELTNTGFLRFPNFELGQKSWLSLLAKLCGAAINALTDIGRSAGAIAIAFPVTSGDFPGHSDGSPVSRHATGGHPRPWQRAAAGGWHEDG